ncbi:MAG: tagatose-bisphosphate aldolase [Candidatus Zambryskibacteria bacterium CG11_big_fil_rev_8_21_14_0_20_42_18]|uniref:Tagatose-bisphosphate aldolase n=1 Tax=Candidatus Zambryskibacteria bacterium CG_4_9_14_3_um_filter_42_15 TaxID=1975112 RepID=A0A2M7WSV8_9BACT|nr:MAG: tagatose-bisphosphate aldolase [Candidatus Zambryskibacteria bacterium CG11_big_fil_rev_8_21_14_0_20_42_18]PJA33079.1 MAG: tagatose-bisphosphate aldolase [Candidatus Zambryskibacteria bacterium CG_4_9_14_3_um_filter_42_15]
MKSLREVLDWAEEKKVAIGHFNVSDSLGFKAVVETAKDLDVPVIVGVSEKERDFIGLEEVVALVKTARENNLNVFINADHTYSLERAMAAIDAGVDSIVVDGADKTFAENIALTKEVVSYARSKNTEIIVEGEIGFIGKSSKVIENLPDGVSLETQTNPEDAREFVKETGIDLLAPSVGNVHGIVKTGNPKLNIERIGEIHKAVGIPLVLHGGSGIADEDFRKAIKAGIRLIHINTEIRVAYKEGIEEGLKSSEIAPYQFLAKGVEEMKKVIRERLKLFNGL